MEQWKKVWMMMMVMMVSMNGGVSGYKNYTVGEDLGWFDKLEKSSVNYQKWASSHTFSLGDFLLFNTDNNHTVVQTYNSTIYSLCDDSTSLDNDTVTWSSPDPSATNVHPVFVAVPLLKVGPTYFFSSDYDGEQCENGQRFSINVTHGQGLPPSLRTPSPGAPGPVGQQSGDDTVPDTLVPANFDHPKDISDDDSDDDDDGKKKKSNATIIQTSRWGFSRILILLGLLYTCW
ncbi:cucumber peeling cupredoxin [Cynara cardunculus var. scolymus]|uniref:Cupredoxin n=1 Tax=Cynara cardunculus var. scolymus TaxID=59895 RepID=A0A103YFG3_CYNCS|nr:cucumber peeling cupredoxin [Cynara cardunculus var. scolymus]KVI08119.1 Cupredoxin [Cynara cardunculus var. scolymus]